MSSISTLPAIDYASLPRTIRIPDTAGSTRDIFALKLNPNHEEAEAGCHAWFDSFGLHSGPEREKFLSAGYCGLASYCYADADLDHLRTVMDFIMWLIAFDDMADEGEFCDSIEAMKHAFAITLDVLRNPDAEHPNLKYVVALKSFYNRMRADASPTVLQHFIKGAEGYMEAAVQDAIDKAAGRVLTIEEYIHLRAESSGVKWAYAAMEYAHGIELPDEVHNDPVITELGLAGNQILTWMNDIYSFSLEQARGYTHNFLFVVMWSKQLDLQGAVDFVGELIQKRVKEYIEIKSRLRSFGPELDVQVARYIQGIEYCIQGNLSWSLTTPRYFGADCVKVQETGIVELMDPVVRKSDRANEVKVIEPVISSALSSEVVA